MPEPNLMPKTWAPGAMIPGTVYRVIRPIGEGGMGEVYEVEHNLLGTRRALKVLVKHYAGREDLTERLRVEARGLARLKHINLVEVYDLGTAADGRIFFAMELLDGVTLRAMLRDRGRLSVRTSVELVVQVLAGLHAAHEAAILHRDVKPENVFVCRTGTVKLLDFGVAKTIDAWFPHQKLTAAGMTVGTPRYMSPEQAEGAPVDARTDLYATGQMLWEMLAGRPAFDETDPYDLAKAKRTRGVLPLGQFPGVDASAALCAAVDRACQIEPANRYASAAQFIRALRSAVGGAQVVQQPSRPAPRTQPFSAEAVRSSEVDTQIDASLGVAVGGTVLLPGGVARELTERVEDLQPVDRDALTHARRKGPPPKGPRGTELLPAVAAHREPAMGRSTSILPSTQLMPQRPASASPGPLGIPYLSWLAGVAAFTVPVLIAVAIGVWQFRKPALPQPTDQSVSPSRMSTSAPASSAPMVPEASTIISTPDTSASASSSAPSTTDVAASSSVAPASPASTGAKKPPSVASPAKTSPKKMPGSGL